MAMTMTQKLLAKKAGLDSVAPDQLISCRLDLMLGNDITAPVAIDQFNRLNLSKTHDPEKIVLIPDHFTPNKDIKSASQAKKMRDFARKMHIPHYYEVGSRYPVPLRWSFPAAFPLGFRARMLSCTL